VDLSKVAINGTLNPICKEDIDSVEQAYGIRFPAGYSEFFQRFGEGELSEICVFSPIRIVQQVEEWRSMALEGWFMINQSTEISAEKAMGCYLFADTQSGDDFIFHPDSPDDIYVLPRYSNDAISVKGGFAGMLGWYESSSLMVQPEDWIFFPY